MIRNDSAGLKGELLMRRLSTGASLALLLLSASCGQRPNRMAANESLSDERSLNVVEVEEPADRSGPQIAYTHEATYWLDGNEIAAVQRRHLDLCRSLGPNRCLVLSSRLSAGNGGSHHASAQLVVDARIAQAFNNRLDAVASGSGGAVASRSVAAEDVTKQVIDTNARVRAKEALAARLLALIGSTRGNVGELVAAEKAYADTQEELEAARSLQASLRRRVAMSQIDINYSAVEAESAFAPVREAIGSAGITLGQSVRVLITAAVALLPWLLMLMLIGWIWRRLGWRGPIRRFRDWRSRRAPA